MSRSPDEREPSVFDLEPQPGERPPGASETSVTETSVTETRAMADDTATEARATADDAARDDTPTDEAPTDEAPTDNTPADAPTDEAQGEGDDEPGPGLSTPLEYLVEICGLHQVVLLGDRPGVSQHLAVLADAIAPLHAAGVTNLAWEFTNSRAQGDLDRLLTASSWEPRACADLFVDLMGIGFAYHEYAQVLQAVWKVNVERGDQQPMRVVGLGVPTYVEDPALLEGRSAGELDLRNWWMGGHYRDLTAFHMSNVLTTEVLRKGERVLVYCDVARTTTRLIEWIDGLATVSVGNLLHRWMGEGVQRVVFHGAIGDPAAIQRVEELIDAAPEDIDTLGIDLELSTLGSVGLGEVVGSTDGEQTSFRLREIADGYLFVTPRSQWTPAEVIDDLVTPQNYREIEARYRALDPSDSPYTLEQLVAVQHEGRAALEAGWPQLPEPEPEPQRRGRFRRR